jgi:hypothetical protein
MDSFTSNHHHVLHAILNKEDEAIGKGQVPRNIREAFEYQKWTASVYREFDALKERNTWIIVKTDISKPILRSLWVFKIKDDGLFKSRLTVDGSPEELSSSGHVQSNQDQAITASVTCLFSQLALGYKSL